MTEIHFITNPTVPVSWYQGIENQQLWLKYSYFLHKWSKLMSKIRVENWRRISENSCEKDICLTCMYFSWKDYIFLRTIALNMNFNMSVYLSSILCSRDKTFQENKICAELMDQSTGIQCVVPVILIHPRTIFFFTLQLVFKNIEWSLFLLLLFLALGNPCVFWLLWAIVKDIITLKELTLFNDQVTNNAHSSSELVLYF